MISAIILDLLIIQTVKMVIKDSLSLLGHNMDTVTLDAKVVIKEVENYLLWDGPSCPDGLFRLTP